MSEIVIRRFLPHDRDALRDLFGRAGEGAPTASLWGHVSSEAAVYLDPYMDRAPESLFVAAADDLPVGYLAGCLRSAEFPTESARIASAIRAHRLIVKPGPAMFLARSLLDITRTAVRREPTAGELDDPRWPAHLHINLLPCARGTGAATRLMNQWFDTLVAHGSPGCYLQTLVENARAVRFFRRMGFTEHGPTPPVPGLRYKGQQLHQQTMVLSIPPS